MDVGVIADDIDQQRLFARLLQTAGFSVAVAGDRESGIELVKRDRPRVVVCDYDLPDGNGVEFCSTLRENPDFSDIYLILTSSDGTRTLVTDALNAGADDYLAKPIDHGETIARIRVGTRMWNMHEQLRRAAVTDGLTGLYNHDHFNRVLDAELSRARRYGHPLALVMMDLDHFKAINDTFGHLAGNSALERTAQILRDSVRDMDTIGRFGGDEFAIAIPRATLDDAAQIAERIRLLLADSLHVDTLRKHVVTASFGVADSDDPRVNGTAGLVDLADRALYLAKRRDRNQVAKSVELHEGSELPAVIQMDDIERLRERLVVLSTRAKDACMQSVASLVQVLDERDPLTARHGMNVAFYGQQLAEQMESSKAITEAVYNAGLLHDIGKVGVPDHILMKRTPLTSLERMVFEQVPLIGARVVGHLRVLETEVQIIRHQREYYDGSGFPSGLTGDQIPIGARILLVADAFDAITTDRIYRRRRPIDEAVVEIRDLAGKQFDPRVTTALQKTLELRRPLWQQRIDETVRSVSAPGTLQPCAVLE